jgi:hypothetical protein
MIKKIDKYKFQAVPIFALILIFLCGCCTTIPTINTIDKGEYLDYQPIPPIPVSKVTIYDSLDNIEKEVFWNSLENPKAIRPLLPLQSAQISVTKIDASGKIGFISSSMTGEIGSYKVIIDYMKYRIEQVFNDSGKYIGSGRIGVGLRIMAVVVTSKANLNLGSLSSIGLEAKAGNLSGGITVDIVGIDSEDITNLIPLTSEIDQSSIQSILQSLASIKAKLWEDESFLTPHLVAFSQSEPNKESEIRTKISTYTYSNTKSSNILMKFVMPDGENYNETNLEILKNWMVSNRLDDSPGFIVIFINAKEYEELRKNAVIDLRLNK